MKKSENRNTKIGIVIVTHNSSLSARITLSSIAKAKTLIPFDLILVDNGSLFSERKLIRRAIKFHNFKENKFWKYIQSPKNLGFSGGNNLAIRKFLKDDTNTHICLLNSDVIVSDYWLDRLVEKNADLVTPVTNMSDSSQVIPIDFSIDKNTCFGLENEVIFSGEFEKVNSFSENRFNTFQGNGVEIIDHTTFFCVLIRRDVFLSVGFLDEYFFPGGFEDLDFCLRVNKNNQKIILARDVFIFHFGSSSFGLLQLDYFNQQRLINIEYFENKHCISWEKKYSHLVTSFIQDLLFHINNEDVNVKHQRYKILERHFNAISDLIDHISLEQIHLINIFKKQDHKYSNLEILEKTNYSNKQISLLWRTIISKYHKKIKTMELSTIEINNLIVLFNRLSPLIDKQMENIVQIIDGINNNDNVTPDQIIQTSYGNRINKILLRISKFVKFLKNFDGVVFFGGYPFPERDHDGYYQRIRSVDVVFSNQTRIFVDNYAIPGRSSWFERPAQNVLVIRLGHNWKQNLVSKICIYLFVLKCKRIYFHSILSIPPFNILLNLPGILKTLDLHGVVPEEFGLYGEIKHKLRYDHVERQAIKKSDLIIVVTDKMREHICEKYQGKTRGEFILLPIMKDLDWAPTIKPKINGRFVVVYAGGTQKWQQIGKMINTIEKNINGYMFRIFCPSPSEFNQMLPDTLKNNRYLSISNKASSEIIDEYKTNHFGFILRENNIINRVACPTKLIEYLGMGIVPIVDSVEIGDFNNLGMQYIHLENFQEGNIPDTLALMEIAKTNLELYKYLRKTYYDGITKLKCCFLEKNQPQKKVYAMKSTSECDILIQVENFLSGGLENVVLGINKKLVSKGLKICLLVMGEKGPAVDEAISLGIPVYFQPFEKKSYERFIKKLSPKILFSHYSYEGSEICACLNIPFIQVIHNTYMWFDEVQLNKFQQSIPFTEKFIACSEYALSYSIERLHVPESKIMVIPNGIDTKRIKSLDSQKLRGALRGQLGFDEKDFVFLCVAAVTYQKNLYGLIKSFHLALKECPQAKLVIVGPNYQKEIMRQIDSYINKNRLEKHIYYLGEKKEAYRYYFMADGFITASFFEGGQLVLLEALTANLPIISTDVGFAKHFHEQEGVKIVPPPIDVFKYYGTIVQLSSNITFEKKLAEAIKDTYDCPQKPNIPSKKINLMNNNITYNNYYSFLNKYLSTKENSTA